MNRCVSDHCCYLPMIGYSSRKCPPPFWFIHLDSGFMQRWWKPGSFLHGKAGIFIIHEANALFLLLYISFLFSHPTFPPPLPFTGCCSEFSQAKVVCIEMRSLKDGALSLCIYSHVCGNWSKSLFEPQNGALNVKWGLKSAWTNL